MAIKDYYKTLQVSPQATVDEIKKAYRMLAQQYHPDKNSNDPYAAAYFYEVKEAYETLTNPVKKDVYLQQRWYQKSKGPLQTTDVITPVTILKKAIALEQDIARADIFRMNPAALWAAIDELLSSPAIHVLQTFNEPAINRSIIQTLLKPLALLTATHGRLVGDKLLQIAGQDTDSILLVQEALAAIQLTHRRQQYKWAWVLLFIIGICLLIEFGSR
ncbi:MAG: hypothetical protein RL172_4 [Bacteroidota bacterium]|jgi:molecular chaperone DnaJ